MRVILLLTLIHFAVAGSFVSFIHPSRALAVVELEGIATRQTPLTTIPDACKTDCDQIEAETISQQCPVEECCQDSFVSGYANCLKCIGGTMNVTDYTSVQRVLDDLIVQCDFRGDNVTRVSLPGIDPNHPLPSAPAVNPNAPTQSTISIGGPSFPSSSATGTAPPQASNSASSAKAERFSSPHFSHMPASVVLFGGLMVLVM